MNSLFSDGLVHDSRAGHEELVIGARFVVEDKGTTVEDIITSSSCYVWYNLVVRQYVDGYVNGKVVRFQTKTLTE